MHTSVQMTLTVSLILDELVNKLLTKTVVRDGQEFEVERIIPFRLKYRLSRNKATLDRDYKAYQQKQLMYLAQYGELTADGTHFEIKDPQRLEAYKQSMEAALSTVLEHTVVKIDPEDFENLKDDAGLKDLPIHMINLLQAYLVDDDPFLEDVTSEIRWNTYQPKEPTPIETAVALTQAVAEESKPEEIKVEEPKTEAPKKKAPAKKKAAELKVEEPKAEESVKSTKKKTPAKTAEKAEEPVKAPAKKKTAKTTEVKAKTTEVKSKKTRTKKTAAEVAEVKDKE